MWIITDLRKKIGLFTALSLLFLFSSLCFSEAAAQQESQQSLETLGNQMHISLGSLRSLSMSLTEDLEKQQKRAETLQTQLTELTISSSNMNKQLYDSETKSIRLENDCKRKNKIILVETLAIMAHLVAAIALLVISSKGIKFIPDFVKILL